MGAARAPRRFPVVLEGLADGSVNLTTIGLLAAHLTTENHREFLEAARGKSKRQVEELVARVRPKPPVAAAVRRLPISRATAASPAAPHDAVGSADQAGHPQAAGHAAPPPARPAVVVPLAPQRYKVQFTASAETVEKLRRAQALRGHKIGDGDPAAIIDRALSVLLQDLGRQKMAATDRPRGSHGPTSSSRHMPAAVRRAVWLRDGGRCAFVSRTGRRCAEEAFLEFHHVVPYAAGGAPTADNIQLRCRAHNGYEAELYFGPPARPSVREGGASYRCPDDRRSWPSGSVQGLGPDPAGRGMENPLPTTSLRTPGDYAWPPWADSASELPTPHTKREAIDA